MNVYVVLTGDYEDVYIYGVFSSLDAAEAACKTPKGRRKRGCWKIESHVVVEER